jgi:prepilin-type N-terminal cleavage/methylation domain-containing protein
MTNFYRKGITIIELLVVLAVLGIIFSIVVPQFSKMRENQVLKSGVQDILSSLDKARSQTLASLNSSEYGVRFESDRIIIFKGDAFSPNTIDNETINIVTPASISSVTLNLVSGISGEMYFNRLSGSPSKTGTVTISTTSYSKRITISATGVASVD